MNDHFTALVAAQAATLRNHVDTAPDEQPEPIDGVRRDDYNPEYLDELDRTMTEQAADLMEEQGAEPETDESELEAPTLDQLSELTRDALDALIREGRAMFDGEAVARREAEIRRFEVAMPKQGVWAADIRESRTAMDVLAEQRQAGVPELTARLQDAYGRWFASGQRDDNALDEAFRARRQLFDAGVPAYSVLKMRNMAREQHSPSS